jgi:hypothetical protein
MEGRDCNGSELSSNESESVNFSGLSDSEKVQLKA